MKRFLLYMLLSITAVSVNAQSLKLEIEPINGFKTTYLIDSVTFISKGSSQDYMIVHKTNGEEKEYPVNEIKSMQIVEKNKVHEFVDLGLPSGIKWATCNVGANSAEDYGWYFAWGEVDPKDTYNWSTYFDSVDGSQADFNKYDYDKQTELDAEDDAAHANWGGSWRMPTKAEFNELLKECRWDWTTQNGINGYKVTGPNGNSIFLPAAGTCLGSTLDVYAVGRYGKYWQSSLGSWHSTAWILNFDIGHTGGLGDNIDYMYDRAFGLSVRAVCP